jgi:hypothetical protein
VLPGCGEEGADEREVHGALQRPKAAGDFLTKLHHAAVAFGRSVGEWNSRIVKKAQRVLFARREAQGPRIMDRWPVAPIDQTQFSRSNCVKSELFEVPNRMRGDEFGHRVDEDLEIVRGTLCQILMDRILEAEFIFGD